MKRYTRILSLVMSVLMIAALFCGCGRESKEIEALAGTWYMTKSGPESVAQALLENIDLCAEEIACVDLTTLESVKTVTFTTDKTYQFAYDPDGTRACARTFFEGTFYAMYENRGSLGQLYGVDFESASKEEFLQFYADIYGAADFPGLLDMIADNSFDFDAMAEPEEEGTYSMKNGVISMTLLDGSNAGSVDYSLQGDSLSLTYTNSVEVYSRSK